MRKKTVDIFKLQALGLREKQVDDGYPESVEDGEDDVCAPSDVADSMRCDLHNDLAMC